MATMRDVAERAGVSLSTVSHVINETRYVSAVVRQRVLDAMEALEYRPNELARSLRRGQTNTIGLILPDSSNPYFAEIGQAIEVTAFARGYNVILCNTSNDLTREELYVDVLRNKQVDGIIFVASGDRSESVRELLRSNYPVVLVDRSLKGVELDAVLVNNYDGGCQAIQHLIDLGHTRIGCVTGPHNLTPSAERITGYRDTLESNGLPYDEALIMPGDFRPNSGYQAATTLLQSDDPPTGIFACNDLMALGVMRAATTLGLRVPDDLSIVGFDNIELASYSIPPLTTVSQPTNEMGRTGVQMLIHRIETNEDPPGSAVLQPELVIRGTTGARS